MDKKEAKKELHTIDSLIKLVKGLIEKEEKNEDINTGLIFGLIFGLLANFVMIMIYQLLIKNLSRGTQVWVALGGLFFVAFFLWIGMKESKKYKKNKRELTQKLNLFEIQKEGLVKRFDL